MSRVALIVLAAVLASGCGDDTSANDYCRELLEMPAAPAGTECAYDRDGDGRPEAHCAPLIGNDGEYGCVDVMIDGCEWRPCEPL